MMPRFDLNDSQKSQAKFFEFKNGLLKNKELQAISLQSEYQKTVFWLSCKSINQIKNFRKEEEEEIQVVFGCCLIFLLFDFLMFVVIWLDRCEKFVQSFENDEIFKKVLVCFDLMELSVFLFF